MIYTWYFTAIAALGCFGAFLNIRDRTRNIKVLNTIDETGEALRIAKMFRISAMFWITELTIMFLMGLAIIYIRFWPETGFGTFLARNFRIGFPISFCAMATIAVFNVWYFWFENRHRKPRSKHSVEKEKGRQDVRA